MHSGWVTQSLKSIQQIFTLFIKQLCLSTGGKRARNCKEHARAASKMSGENVYTPKLIRHFKFNSIYLHRFPFGLNRCGPQQRASYRQAITFCLPLFPFLPLLLFFSEKKRWQIQLTNNLHSAEKTKKLVKVGNKNLLQCLQASLISVMIGRFIFFWLLCGIKKNTHRRCQNRSSSEPSTSLITHRMCGCVIRIIKSGFNTMHGSDRPGIININVDSYYY